MQQREATPSPPATPLQVLATARHQHLRVSNHTDLAKGTVHSHVADSLAKLGYVLVECTTRRGDHQRWCVITAKGRALLDMPATQQALALEQAKADAPVEVPATRGKYDAMSNTAWAKLCAMLDAKQQPGEGRNRHIDRVWAACEAYHAKQQATTEAHATAPTQPTPTVAPTTPVVTAATDALTLVRCSQCAELYQYQELLTGKCCQCIETTQPNTTPSTEVTMTATTKPTAPKATKPAAKCPITAALATCPVYTAATPEQQADMVLVAKVWVREGAVVTDVAALAGSYDTAAQLLADEAQAADPCPKHLRKYLPSLPTVSSPDAVPTPAEQPDAVVEVQQPTPTWAVGDMVTIAYVDATGYEHLVGTTGKVKAVVTSDTGEVLYRVTCDKGGVMLCHGSELVATAQPKAVATPSAPKAKAPAKAKQPAPATTQPTAPVTQPQPTAPTVDDQRLSGSDTAVAALTAQVAALTKQLADALALVTTLTQQLATQQQPAPKPVPVVTPPVIAKPAAQPAVVVSKPTPVAQPVKQPTPPATVTPTASPEPTAAKQLPTLPCDEVLMSLPKHALENLCLQHGMRLPLGAGHSMLYRMLKGKRCGLPTSHPSCCKVEPSTK